MRKIKSAILSLALLLVFACFTPVFAGDDTDSPCALATDEQQPSQAAPDGAVAGINERIILTGGNITDFAPQRDAVIDDCAPVVALARFNPLNSSPLPNPPNSGDGSESSPDISVFDPAISKIGFSTPGEPGVTGEQLEWVVTVRNNGSAPGRNIVVSDTLRDELRVDEVISVDGFIAVNGQTVTVTIPELAAGASTRIIIRTTLLEGGGVIDNTACISATSLQEICATGVAISQLPATGETPIERLIMELVGGMVLVLVGVALSLWATATVIEQQST